LGRSLGWPIGKVNVGNGVCFLRAWTITSALKTRYDAFVEAGVPMDEVVLFTVGAG
jgi:hypothetical protein